MLTVLSPSLPLGYCVTSNPLSLTFLFCKMEVLMPTGWAVLREGRTASQSPWLPGSIRQALAPPLPTAYAWRGNEGSSSPGIHVKAILTALGNVQLDLISHICHRS